MLIGVPRETAPLERRVALSADSVGRLASQGYTVVIEAGAGESARISDDDFRAAGARVGSSEDVWSCDLIAVINAPDASAETRISQATTIVGLLAPLDQPETMDRLASRGATLLAFELVPRTTRAQGMDALSSQATAVGYAAVIVAAEESARFFPMLTTAAGTIRPARVLVLGAGVAGLQAIATARRLGARATGYDVRAAAREQVASLGAEFIELEIEAQDAKAAGGYAKELASSDQQRQLEQLAPHVAKADVIITTAGVPGKQAPLLVTGGMVSAMRPGSVIVDTMASLGGNCELTEPDMIVAHDGVSILGPTDLPSRVATHSSRMYGRNVVELVTYISTPRGIDLDPTDEIVSGSLVAHKGEITHPAVAELLRGRA